MVLWADPEVSLQGLQSGLAMVRETASVSSVEGTEDVVSKKSSA